MEEKLKLRDSLQVKVGVVFLLLAIAFSTGSYVAIRWLVFPAFAQLEREAAIENLERVRQLFDAELAALSILGREYSIWNQTSDFVSGNAPNYVHENLNPEGWVDIDVDAMAFFALDGDLVWSASFDPRSRAPETIDIESLRPLLDARAVSQGAPLNNAVSGMLDLPQGCLMVVVQPVVRTDGSGPVTGFYAIGRYVTPQRLDEFRSRAGVDFHMDSLDSQVHSAVIALSRQSAAADKAQQLGEPDHLKSRFSSSAIALRYNDGEVISSEVWRDVFGADMTVLDVRTPRKITALGTSIQKMSVLFLACVSLLFVLLSWAAVRRLVVNPITRLKEHVIEVGKTGDLSLSIDLNKSDELGTLAQEFDLMTSQLQVAHVDLLEARDQALSSVRMKSEFLASMSHEIRTPMNGVIGMTELLYKTDLSTSQRKLVDMVKISGNSLLSIINDILDFSKIEAGKLSIQKSALELEKLVGDVNAVIAEPAQRKGLKYSCNLSPDLPQGVVADDHRLRQVLINLLDNAIKFTDAGAVVLSISCPRSWWRDGEEWGTLKFSVADTGIGIRKDLKNKIFQSFSQADGSTTRVYGGTGLGLTICKQLVELMGGKISFKSQEGHGADFWIVLPVKFDRSYVSSPTRSPAGTDSLEGLNALLVDSNPTNRSLVASHFRQWRVRSDTAGIGGDALLALANAAKSGRVYDFVLIDSHLPDMQGLSLAQKLNDSSSYGRPTVILLGAVEQNLTADQLAAQGVYSCLSKPILLDELHGCLCRSMDKEQRADYPPSVQATAFDHRELINMARENKPNASEPNASGVVNLERQALDQIKRLDKEGQPSILDRIIDAYLEASPAVLAALLAGVKASDARAVELNAHTLKSSSESLGARSFSRLCLQLEHMGRSGELEGATNLLESLQSEFPAVCEALSRERSTAKGMQA